MTITTHLFSVGLFPAAGLVGTQVLAAENKGKILIVLSSESELPLKNGKSFATGYYLNELTVPAERFVQAGYELVFTDPKGNLPSVDQASISSDYFDGSNEKLQYALSFQKGLSGLSHPLLLSEVARSDLSQYKAIFVPGGPAPMIDLMADKDLGKILVFFHDHRKMTVLLCHAPIVLLSAASNPSANQQALRDGNLGASKALTSSWPYKSYRVTVFSDEEEKLAAQNVFHAEPFIYPERALVSAGARVSNVSAWHANVVEDRELITGQNPFSDFAMMNVVLKTLATNK